MFLLLFLLERVSLVKWLLLHSRLEECKNEKVMSLNLKPRAIKTATFAAFPAAAATFGGCRLASSALLEVISASGPRPTH